MNARLEFLVSPAQAGAAALRAPVGCCPRYSPSDAPPAVITVAADAVKWVASFFVRFAELSTAALGAPPPPPASPCFLK